MSSSNKESRNIITFIGPGKTGTSSIYEAVKKMNKFDLISQEIKETYIHSFKDIRSGSYGNLIWGQKLIDKLTNDFKKKLSINSKKKLILIEPSYADSENALNFCSNNSETIIITIRPVLKRISSHLIMDNRLGILNFNNLNQNKSFLERLHYYLSLSNYSFLYEKLKSLGTNMDKVCFLDLKNKILYKNNKHLINEELIKEIAIKANEQSENSARIPKNKLIEYLYKNKYLRIISRLKLLKEIKKYFNDKFFLNIDNKKRQKLEDIIYKSHKSSIDAIEFNNQTLLVSKSRESIFKRN